MRRDRLTPGVILVLIGAVVLLRNFGYLHFHWSNILHLWPIFLVIGGVNLIFANNRSIWATVIKLTVIVVGVGLLLFGDFGDRNRFFPTFYFNGHHHKDNDDDDMDIDLGDDKDDSDSTTTNTSDIVKVDGNSFYHTAFAPGTRIARLNLSGGGTTYNLSDTTNDLFAANVKEFSGRYTLKNHTDDSVSVVDFNMNNQHRKSFTWGDNKANTATLKLNPNPLWDVNIKAGATSLDFDLAKFKVRSLVLSGGAASFSIKLGQPVENNTRVNISSGVSDITVSVPKDAACMINSSTGLSSNNFDGFSNNGDNEYKTPGFDAAKNKIYITISGGLSDFKVRRY
ncbi:LiaI-LiaF-like domain-containing protein [Mucilaginibacter polytrichastri]|uniref:LiaI-LiaF-like transmembrane region domain-containing protein n=1 Tax=Mucilaginibacter polytrichastri TaxID=1302689 RepID=A0A1Q6A1H0_9SPHI|nr:DUF5668 domain-containing protein [Mucilaginibacter polytrichastri]OKS87867.1 hypothetical protein RG47T_3330 [Mucilaginibacter polytrichastri]SFT26158.1 hypothetical protein SAMN04487890_12457 [Mucilaginibacter polytrichastri]